MNETRNGLASGTAERSKPQSQNQPQPKRARCVADIRWGMILTAPTAVYKPGGAAHALAPQSAPHLL